MFNWLTRVVSAVTIASSLGISTTQQLPNLPTQPTQDQVKCHSNAWEKTSLTPVQGQLVHKKLAPYVEKLLDDSTLTGYSFTLTSAYRTCGYQKELRAQACGGTDNFSLYEQNPETCTPPTEPAGRSLHNEGLAVDFGCQGYSIFAYSPCYSWLLQNASKYQLHNRPGEPWHWSTTGR